MSKFTYCYCPGCGRNNVHVDVDRGVLHDHRNRGYTAKCTGSGRPATERRAYPLPSGAFGRLVGAIAGE
jgi:hypothetical protein